MEINEADDEEKFSFTPEKGQQLLIQQQDEKDYEIHEIDSSVEGDQDVVLSESSTLPFESHNILVQAHSFYLDSLVWKMFKYNSYWINKWKGIFNKNLDVKLYELNMTSDVPGLRRQDCALHVADELEQIWPSISSSFRHQSTAKYKIPLLLRAFLKMEVWSLAISLLLSTVSSVLSFIVPFLLMGFIELLNDSETSKMGENQFWFWICFYTLGISFFSYIINSNLFIMGFKKGIVSAGRFTSAIRVKIFRNVIRKLDTHASAATNPGQLINFVTADCMAIQKGVSSFIRFFPMVISIIILTCTLIALFGWSALISLGVILLAAISNFITAKKIAKLIQVLMEKRDKRIDTLSNIIENIKAVKFFVWEEKFCELSQKIRSEELYQMRKINSFVAFQDFIGDSFITAGTIILFLCFVCLFENELSDSKAYGALVLFSSVQEILIDMPHCVEGIISAFTSFGRIGEYLGAQGEIEELDERFILDSSSDIAVSFNNATFIWNEELNKDEIDLDQTQQPFQLSDITIDIPTNKLTVITGKVGSGKSTFLRSILGDLKLTNGSLHQMKLSSIAYSPQIPFILNATIKENILFGEEFEKDRFWTVCRVCQLLPDLEKMANGINTELGERGINLSGGQKARLSLARACYSKSRLILLDDVMAAVDSQVQRNILQECVLGFLKDRTVILTSHMPNVIMKADFVIGMGGGKVIFKGNPSEFYNISHSELVQDVQDQKTDLSVVNQVKVEDYPTLPIDNEETKEEKGKLTSKEQVTRSLGQAYIFYFRNLGILFCISLLLFTPISRALPVLSNWWLGEWIDAAKNSKNGNFIPYTAIYVALGIGTCISSFIYIFGIYIGNVQAVKRMHQRLMTAAIYAKMNFFDKNPSGRIINRFSSDIISIEDTGGFTLYFFTVGLFQTLSIFIMLIIELPLFLVFLPFIVILFIGLQQFYEVSSVEMKRLQTIQTSPLFEYFSQCLKGCSTIRSFHKEAWCVKAISTKIDNAIRVEKTSIHLNWWFGLRLDFLSSLIVFTCCLVALFSKYVFTNESSVSAKTIGLCLSYVLRVSTLFRVCVLGLQYFQNAMTSVERIKEYCDEKSEQEWANSIYNTRFETRDDRENVSFTTGSIEFVDFSTKYRNDLDPVIKNLNLKIKDKQKVGICGRTGSGKTTLTLSLLRLLEPSEGKLIIDDRDVTDLSIRQLRSNITVIPQDPTLFVGTIRFNLDPFDEFDDFQIWNCLKKVKLDSKIQNLNTPVENSGSNFSCGERQLLCLSRALLKKSPIIILDEATANIDLKSDQIVQETIHECFQDSTVLIIAHRLNTIVEQVDKVIVMKEGSIAEEGSPIELLERHERLNGHSVFIEMIEQYGTVNANLIKDQIRRSKKDD